MPTQEPVFTRFNESQFYWLDPTTTVAGFLAASTTLGATPELSQTWGDAGGLYVMLGQAPSDATKFLADLTTYLAQTSVPGARFLWIRDPDAGPLAWHVQALVLQAVTQAGVTTWTVKRMLSLAFADYTVVLRGGGTIAPAEAGDAGWGFSVADPPGGAAATLFAPDATFDSAGGTTMLAFAGSAAGAWRFRLDVPEPGPDGFAQLGCAIRYFTGDATTGDVQAVHFGVLTQPADTAFSLYATLDPLRPLVGAATHLSFFSWSTPGAAPAFGSGYATSRGYAVNLHPQASPGIAARLVFAVAPYFAGPAGYYLAPEGNFGIQVVPPSGITEAGIERLICGTSGIEYLGIPAQSGGTLVFEAGQPAYAPLVPNTEASQTLTSLGTTSWVYAAVPPGAKLAYYAQPEDAPLYGAASAGKHGETPLLDYMEIPAIAPPPALAFPMAPFRGLDADRLATALQIEQQALAPLRRQLLMSGASGAVPPAAPTTQVGVTPQGLAIGVSAAGDWNWAAVGLNAASAAEPDLRFTKVTGDFKQALLTNNLFMVLADPTAVLGSDDGSRPPLGSVGYQLTAALLDVIGSLPDGVPQPVLAAVQTYLSARSYPAYDDLTSFKAALREASPGITDAQIMVFRRFGGLLTPVIGDWTFRLSPDNWQANGRQTYVIYKFVVGRSLRDLANDVSAWVWPAAVANDADGLTDASKAIAGIIDEAAKNDGHGSFYAHFNRVAADASWTGVIALSVDVPLDELPPELQVLAAGIDPAKFSAHHLGFAATPFQLESGALGFTRSSMFGLIDYQNPEDQYFSSDVHFAFRVQQLAVGFENSVVTTFGARVQLLINRLFGAPTRLFPSVHGNNVILVGALQRQTLPDGSSHDSYYFAMPGENVFQLDGLVLQTVTLLSTQLVTTQAVTPGGGATEVKATFQLTGNLSFYEPDGFDPFCWGRTSANDFTGYLRFGNLAIDMSFSPGDPAGTTVFTLRDGSLAFDLANSLARPNALVQRFPARLARLIATPDPLLTPGSPLLAPEDFGFVSVGAPIDQGQLSAPWYGLVYTIDLGTLGALAGSTGLALEVLAAWSPGQGGTTPAMYIGVKLPGTKEAFGVSLPLQGFMKLGFRSIELLVDNEPGQPRTYTLRLRDFALRMLGLSFPSGHNDICLFGNPNQSGPAKVGWYAAYTASGDAKKQSALTPRRVVRQARAAARPSERT